METLQQKGLTRSSYNSRKECIKMKTMQLATLCGIDACTIIVGPHGETESWPEDPKKAKAIIEKFKDLTNNPNKRVTVRDESWKKVVDVPAAGGEVVSCQQVLTQVKDDFKNVPCGRTAVPDESMIKGFAEHDGEVVSWLENPRGSNVVGKTFEENAEIIDLTEMMVEKSSQDSRQSSQLTGYKKFLKQLDSKLGALAKRIEFLRRHQEFETDSSCVENKQLEYSEKSTCPSPKRRRVSQEPVFLFDLNFPPPDELESSCLSSEDYKDLRLAIV